MGRHARTVPTAENVGDAIANLKPAKREEWRHLAEEQGWEFEEYVTARIKRNIDHRRKLSEQDSKASGDGSPEQRKVDGSTANDGFEAFSTQRIENALSWRKRRRRDSWTASESPTKRCSSTRQASGVRQAQPHPTIRDAVPAALPSGRSTLKRSDSLLGLGQLTQEAPPSGGAASRANTSFTRTTSFVTATEGDEDSHSISSPNLPSPISPTAHGSPSQEDFFKLGPNTQECQNFLDSPQGRALDDLEHLTSPRTHRETSLPPSPSCLIKDPVRSIRAPLLTRLQNVKLEPLKRFRSRAISTPSRAACSTDEEHRCRLCDRLLETKRALLCDGCTTGPYADPDIGLCVRMFNLAEEQTDVLREAAQGNNIFYTGSAGTGKSTTLRALVQYYHCKGVSVEVVSPTGIAALNVGGRTIHMFAGWTAKAEKLPLERLRRIACGELNYRRLSKPDVLIIDEISMVSNFALTRLDQIMRSARKPDSPFGGVQVIFSGDFHQLPPVKAFKTCLTCGRKMDNPNDGPWFHCLDHGSFHKSQQWAFASPTWDECGFHYVELKQIHRQRDPEFAPLLNKVRVEAELTEEEVSLLKTRRPGLDASDITKIYPVRWKVAEINANQLHAIQREQISFKCVDDYWWNEQLHPELEGRFDRVDPDDETSSLRVYSGSEDRHRFDEEFDMKIGMPVILLTNISPRAGLVNGSRGVIVDFEQYGFPSKVPEVALGGKANYDLEDWALFGDHAPYQLEQVLTFIELVPGKQWPIVQFDNGLTCTIRPHCEVEELGHVPEEASQERFSLMSRTQIPLVAGWAITTHKSQGMTLDKAIVDLSGSWEPGQPYTAISRVRSLAGLRVLHTATGKANRADQSVVEFMKKHFGDGRKI